MLTVIRISRPQGKVPQFLRRVRDRFSVMLERQRGRVKDTDFRSRFLLRGNAGKNIILVSATAAECGIEKATSSSLAISKAKSLEYDVVRRLPYRIKNLGGEG